MAGDAAGVGRALGTGVVRVGVGPDATPPGCVQRDEDSEGKAAVDEIINQESDDDEFIQTAITRTRKLVCSLFPLSEYILIALECRGSMVACRSQH